jgi:hypothetical protein
MPDPRPLPSGFYALGSSWRTTKSDNVRCVQPDSGLTSGIQRRRDAAAAQAVTPDAQTDALPESLQARVPGVRTRCFMNA